MPVQYQARDPDSGNVLAKIEVECLGDVDGLEGIHGRSLAIHRVEVIDGKQTETLVDLEENKARYVRMQAQGVSTSRDEKSLDST